MKKYISLIICAILTILSITVFSPIKEDVVAGAGNGKSERIDNPKEFCEVLGFLENYSVSTTGKSSNVGYSLDKYAEEDIIEPKYESVTFYNETVSSTSKSNSNGSFKSRTDRQLSLYIAPNATYYDSKGTVSSESTSKTDDNSYRYETKKYVFKFWMKIYISKDTMLVCVEQWDVYGEDAPMKNAWKNKEMIGKWLEFDNEEGMEALLGINNDNFSVLAGIKDYFDANVNTNFDTNGKTYTLKEELWTNGMSGIFQINLSNPIRPTVLLQQSVKANGIDKYAENNISFTNINNTVIKQTIAKQGNVSEYINLDGE